MLLAGAAGHAGAQERLGTVVIVRVPRDGGVVARIRAELVANDWRVREIGPDPTSARAALPAVVMNLNARAALRMQPARGAIELWVASEGDAAGGGELVRLPAGEQDDGLLALRATEALRARGLRLPRREAEPVPVQPPTTATPSEVPAPRPAQPEPQPTAAEPVERPPSPTPGPDVATEQERARKQAEAERAARERAARESQAERDKALREARDRAERERAERDAEEEAEAEEAEAEAAEAEAEDEPELESHALRPSMLFIEVGPGLGYSPGGASVSFAGWLNLRVQPANDWSLNAFGFVPFAGGTVERLGVRATMRSYLAGGAADLHAAFDRFDISAGAGGAFLITTMEAETENLQFRRANGETEYTAAALARVALYVTAVPRVRLGLRVLFGMAIPKLRMKIGGADEAAWGQPFLLAVLTADFGLPVLLRPR